MILESETSLTSTQYAAMLAERNNFEWRLTAYRWNLNFGAMADNANDPGVYDWDAINFDDTIWRVSDYGADRIDGLIWEDVAGFTALSGRIGNYSLAVNGTDLHVFGANSSGISTNVWDGSAWSGWSSIASISNLRYVAATSHAAVHYITYDGSSYLWNFGVATYSGSWATTASDIHWQYPIYGFDAVTLSGKDVLLFTASAPGNLSAQYIDNQAVKTTIPACGVFSLIYQYGSWSDHFTADFVDEEQTWRYRKTLYASVIDNTIHVCVFTATGTQNYPYYAYRRYTSKDGKHWGRGELMGFTNAYRYGGILLRLGDYVHFTERSLYHRSLATIQVGTPASSTVLDVTNEVKQLNLSRRDMGQISFILSNATGWLDTSILNGDYAVVFKLEAGWYDADAEEIVYQQIGLFDLDSIGHIEGLAKDDVRVTARDYLSRMSSRTQSEDFLQWEPQFGGGDDYVDTTGTDSGALGNTGVLSGAWSTPNESLVLKSKDTEGVAISTITTEMWNGSQQHSFTLVNTSNSEYAGVIFRAQDKDNFYSFFYNQATDKLYITERIAGVISFLWTDSGTRGWASSPSTRRWLKVDFRYGRVIGYTSDDGITWTQRASILTAGQPGTTYDAFGYPIATTQKMFKGFIGVYGRGYSDQDTFSYSPPTYTPPTLSLPPEPVRNLYGSLSEYTTDLIPTKMFVAASGSAQAAIATSITVGGTFIWSEISTGLTGNAIWASSDPFDYTTIYLLTTTGIYKCKPYSFSGWTLVADNATMFGNGTYIGLNILMSINRQGWIYVYSGTSLCAWSTNYGATWSNNSGTGATGIGYSYQRIVVSPFNDGASSVGWMYRILHTGPSNTNTIYKSTDWGQTWSSISTLGMWVGATAGINIPYKKGDGSDNSNDTSQLLYLSDGGGNTGQLVKSTTAGTSWTVVKSFNSSNTRTPQMSYCGNSIQTFTYDGDIVITAAVIPSNLAGLQIYDGSTLLYNATSYASGSQWQVLVQGFSYNAGAALWWNRGGAASAMKYTLDAGANVYTPNLPSFFTGGQHIGYAEWSLIDQWTPPV